MKPIKITQKNSKRIQAELDKANGGATAHTYRNAATMAIIAGIAEDELTSFVSKKAAPGAQWTQRSGSPVAKCYKYSRKATHVELERRATGWFLVDVASVTVWETGGGHNLWLTPAQDELAVKRFREGYHTIKA